MVLIIAIYLSLIHFPILTDIIIDLEDQKKMITNSRKQIMKTVGVMEIIDNISTEELTCTRTTGPNIDGIRQSNILELKHLELATSR